MSTQPNRGRIHAPEITLDWSMQELGLLQEVKYPKPLVFAPLPQGKGLWGMG